MSIAANQQRILLSLLAALRPHWCGDRALPARIQRLLTRDRRFGSRDRRLYRELVYTALRYLPWVEPQLDRAPAFAVPLIAWLASDRPETQRFRAALLADWPPCPATLAGKAELLSHLARFHHEPELTTVLPTVTSAPPAQTSRFESTALLPGWFRDHCPAAFESVQLDALLARAPLWLRLQTGEPETVLAEFDRLGWRWRRAPVLPSAIEVLDEVDLTRTESFRSGALEVQDLGSQLLLETVGVSPGGRWLDACAGAGGKTLQLARLLGAAGAIDAFDVRPAALDELAARTRRAGIAVAGRRESGESAGTADSTGSGNASPGAASIRVLETVEPVAYDGVLVDAPCSGSGTWRRAPHLKWTTSPADIDHAAAMQRELLERFSQRVRSGGRLVYATCSLSRRENEDVIAGFIDAHPEFSPESPARDFGAITRGGGLTFLPALHNTDGFFVAVLRRRG